MKCCIFMQTIGSSLGFSQAAPVAYGGKGNPYMYITVFALFIVASIVKRVIWEKSKHIQTSDRKSKQKEKAVKEKQTISDTIIFTIINKVSKSIELAVMLLLYAGSPRSTPPRAKAHIIISLEEKPKENNKKKSHMQKVG